MSNRQRCRPDSEATEHSSVTPHPFRSEAGTLAQPFSHRLQSRIFPRSFVLPRASFGLCAPPALRIFLHLLFGRLARGPLLASNCALKRGCPPASGLLFRRRRAPPPASPNRPPGDCGKILLVDTFPVSQPRCSYFLPVGYCLLSRLCLHPSCQQPCCTQAALAFVRWMLRLCV